MRKWKREQFKSEIEEQEWNEEEKRIMEEFHKKSEEIPVPESLRPQQMMEKIHKANKRKKYRRYMEAAAVVCAAGILAIVGTQIYNAPPAFKSQNISQTKESSDSNENEKEMQNSVRGFSSYLEVYKVLWDNEQKRNDYYSDFTNEGVWTEVDMDVQPEGTQNKGDNAGVVAATGNYTDTNIQVEGVEESDIVKTDGQYIYVLRAREKRISILDASKENLTVTAQITLLDDLNDQTVYLSGEMYIKDNKLIVLYQDTKEYDPVGVMSIYDISDRENPVKQRTIYQDGYYDESRMVGDIVYLLTDKRSTEVSIPCVNGEKVQYEDMYMDACSTSFSDKFVTITSVNVEEEPEIVNTKSVLTSGDYTYVSKKNIYILSSSNENGKTNTTVFKFSYQDGKIEAVANGIVPGRVRDQFALDEYDGNFRILTTETLTEEIEHELHGTGWAYVGTSNSVYVLDEKLNIIGSITGLAEGERIYSARFAGEKGYFVTYRETDPVFAVDFSDPANPKITGELKVPGFSEYLHFWSEDRMIGIGREQGNDIKISMFDITDPENMKEVHKTVLKNSYAEALYSHKALLINPQKNLLGFHVGNDYSYFDDELSLDGYFSYYLWNYDEERGFEIKLTDKSMADVCRGIQIEDNLYLVYPEEGVHVYSLTTGEQIEKLDF